MLCIPIIIFLLIKYRQISTNTEKRLRFITKYVSIPNREKGYLWHAVGFTPLLTLISSDHSYTSYIQYNARKLHSIVYVLIMSYLDWH